MPMALIHHLAVSPAHRRQGLGRELIDLCLEGLRSDGVFKCHLFVFRENATALEFWEGVGWTERVELTMFSRKVAR